MLKRCATEVEEIRFDRRVGIETRKAVKEYAIPNGYERNLYVSYGPTRISILTKMFSELRVNYEDFIFADVGSGKVRALLVASERDVLQAIPIGLPG